MKTLVCNPRDYDHLHAAFAELNRQAKELEKILHAIGAKIARHNRASNGKPSKKKRKRVRKNDHR